MEEHPNALHSQSSAVSPKPVSEDSQVTREYAETALNRRNVLLGIVAGILVLVILVGLATMTIIHSWLPGVNKWDIGLQEPGNISDNEYLILPTAAPANRISQINVPEGYKIEEHLAELGLEVGYPEDWSAIQYGSGIVLLPPGQVPPEQLQATDTPGMITISVAPMLDLKASLEQEMWINRLKELLLADEQILEIIATDEINVAGNRGYKILARGSNQNWRHDYVLFLVEDAEGGAILVTLQYVASDVTYRPEIFDLIIATITDRVAEVHRESEAYKRAQEILKRDNEP